MLEWIQQTMTSLGYLGIALLMFLENDFSPIPSELIMPLAGFTAGRGDLSFVGVVVAGALETVKLCWGSCIRQIVIQFLWKISEHLTPQNDGVTNKSCSARLSEV